MAALDDKELLARWCENPVFRPLGDEILRQLAERYPPKVYAPGELVHDKGSESLYQFVLLRGVVRIFHPGDGGRQVTVKLMRDPVSFGDMELLHGIRRMESVDALTEALIARIPGDNYIQLLKAYPEATYQNLLHILGAFCVVARNEAHVFVPIDRRLANLLLEYAEFFGEQREDKILITHPLSQNDLAAALGANRRTIAGAISTFTKEQLISKSGDSYLIHDPSTLERLAEPVRNSLCYYAGMPLDDLPRRQRVTHGSLEVERSPGRLASEPFAIEGSLTIGRGSQADLQLPDPMLDLVHCRVFRASTGSRFWVEDLETVNGTRVGGKNCRRGVLRDGDLIEAGACRLRFTERLD